MNILFDHGTPRPLRRFLVSHAVTTAGERGWHRLLNGALIAAAQAEFDAVITTDQGLEYQQNLAGRTLGIIVLMTTNWNLIRPFAHKVVDAADRLQPGDFIKIEFPQRRR